MKYRPPLSNPAVRGPEHVVQFSRYNYSKYIESVFTSHLTSIGINHQYAWIHTPVQNGKVERSHKTDDNEFYQETEIDYSNLEEMNKKTNQLDQPLQNKEVALCLKL